MASSEEDQMKAALSESRMETDPVSGNDVPPGALPEEVRDDVDAKLSEGEYVVPADVLRYYGVKFFEDLRNKAKKSLQAMDEDGRIGGAPIEEEMDDLPFSDEELVSEDDTEGEVMEAAEGALVGYQEGGMQLSYPSYIKQPDLTSLGLTNPTGTASAGGVEYRKYVNDAGMSITIPYFNGSPMGIVPVGYYSEGSAPTQETASIVKEERDGKRDQEPDYEGVDYKSLSDDDLQKAFDQTQGDTTKALGAGSVLAGTTGVGAFAAIGNAVSASQAANEIERRTGKRPETTGLMSKVADFLTGADKIGSMSDVVGKDDSGNDLVSAVKGFDSGMGAVPAPLERPKKDGGGKDTSSTSTDKEDDEEDNGGFREGPMGKNE